MDQPSLTSLIIKYTQSIPEKEAEQKFAKLLYDYRKALDALHDDVASQGVVKTALDTLTGKQTQPITSAEEQHATLVKHFHSKGREIASDYIKDPAVIETIERAWDPENIYLDKHDKQPKNAEQGKNNDPGKDKETEDKRMEMLRQLKEQQERNEQSRDKDYEPG